MWNILREENTQFMGYLPLAIVEGDVSGVDQMRERHGRVVVAVEAA
jgi:hypothetical protein